MPWNPFKMLPKKFLGIDIGTSSIKVVELSSHGQRIKLENYGELLAPVLYKKPFRTFEKNTILLSSRDIARATRAILEEAQIKTKKVCFSIPDFSSFFTWFELPPMTKEELPQAIKYEARRHIPLSLSGVALDWQVTEGRVDNKQTKLKILLVAVPNEVIDQYREIAELTRLQLRFLEAEVFGLARALTDNEKKVMAVVDIGAQSTTVNILDAGVLKRSHSFDVSGNDLTDIISKSMGINYEEAEELKKKHGLLPERELREVLLPLIDLILREIEKTSQDFYQTEVKEIEKVILAGGLALLPGLKEYFFQRLQKEIEIANPFSNLFYPPILENTLKEMGPAYTIATGVALRGLK